MPLEAMLMSVAYADALVHNETRRHPYEQMQLIPLTEALVISLGFVALHGVC